MKLKEKIKRELLKKHQLEKVAQFIPKRKTFFESPLQFFKFWPANSIDAPYNIPLVRLALEDWYLGLQPSLFSDDIALYYELEWRKKKLSDILNLDNKAFSQQFTLYNRPLPPYMPVKRDPKTNKIYVSYRKIDHIPLIEAITDASTEDYRRRYSLLASLYPKSDIDPDKNVYLISLRNQANWKSINNRFFLYLINSGFNKKEARELTIELYNEVPKKGMDFYNYLAFIPRLYYLEKRKFAPNIEELKSFAAKKRFNYDINNMYKVFIFQDLYKRSSLFRHLMQYAL